MAQQEKTNTSGNRKKIGIVFAVILLIALSAYGLWRLSGEDRKPSEILVVTIGEEPVYLDELNFYMLQNVTSLGMTVESLQDSTQEGGVESAEYYKNEILQLIKDIKVEYAVAKKQGIELTEEEKKAVQNDTTIFMGELNGSLLKRFGITQELVKTVYEERYLAKKLEESIQVEETGQNQRYCTMYMLLFPKVQMDETGDYIRAEDGETPLMLSEEDISIQKEHADAAYQELLDGANMEEIAVKYEVDSYSGEESNLVDSFEAPFSKYAYELKEGEISPVLDIESCYAIVKMVKENDEEMAKQIYKYYEADLKNEKIEEQRTTWYQECGVEEPLSFIGSTWNDISLYDYAQYVEE